jgi:hypothetical protein
VLNRSHQYISIKNRILVEEYDDLIILFNDVIAIQTPRNHFADKAWAALNRLDIGIKIKRLSLLHGYPASPGGLVKTTNV